MLGKNKKLSEEIKHLQLNANDWGDRYQYLLNQNSMLVEANKKLTETISAASKENRMKDIIIAKLLNVSLIPISVNLDIGIRTVNCLKNFGIQYLQEIEFVEEKDLKRLPNFGRKSLMELKEACSLHNIKIGSKEKKSWKLVTQKT